MRTETIF